MTSACLSANHFTSAFLFKCRHNKNLRPKNDFDIFCCCWWRWVNGERSSATLCNISTMQTIYYVTSQLYWRTQWRTQHVVHTFHSIPVFSNWKSIKIAMLMLHARLLSSRRRSSLTSCCDLAAIEYTISEWAYAYFISCKFDSGLPAIFR